MQTPLFDPAHRVSAAVTAKFQLIPIDLGVGKIGDEVILEGHALVEFLTVSLEYTALERRAVLNSLKTFKAEIRVGKGTVLFLLGKANAQQLGTGSQ